MKIPELELVTVKPQNLLALRIQLKTVKVPKYCWEHTKNQREECVVQKRAPLY